MSALLPNAVTPLPDKVMIDAPDVTPEISNVPFAIMLLDDDTLPEPVKINLPVVELIVVVPE